jgi:glucosamine kinase
MVEQSYYIGVDGGGTHCRVQLEDEHGNVLSHADAGSANIMTNAAVAMQSIIDASEKAISAIKPISAMKPISAIDKPISEKNKPTNPAIKLNQIHLAAGLAGANIPSALKQFLSLHHPFKSLTVISDLHAACLGAHNGYAGALIICGTGSAATVFTGTGTSTSTNSYHFKDKGGYGLPISDNASGGWLGLEAVKHSLLVFDELIPQSLLSSLVCESLAVSDPQELVTKVAGFKGKEFGALAPSVVAAYEKGCAAAGALIQQGANYLNDVGQTLTCKAPNEKTFTNNQDLPFCLVGGLSHVYQPLLSADLQTRLIEPKSSPQAGVIQYAKQQAALA